MAYQMAATAVTLNDLEGYPSVAGLFKCNLSNTNMCAAFYTISTDSVLTQFLCISRASCLCEYSYAFNKASDDYNVNNMCSPDGATQPEKGWSTT